MHQEEVTFKVWDHTRLRKISVWLPVSAGMLRELIRVANEKLDARGSRLVLEKCGTDVDDTKTLLLYTRKEAVFMLLEDTQRWEPAEKRARTNTQSPHPSNPNLENPLDHASNANGTPESGSSAPGNDSGFGTDEDDSSADNSTPSAPSNQNVTENENVDAQVDAPANDNANNVPAPAPANEQNEAIFFESGLDNPHANFRIRWEYFDTVTLAHLQNGMKPCLQKKRIYFKVVNKVVDDLTAIRQGITGNIAKAAGRMVANKFPNFFIERFADGQIIGNGITKLVSRILNRNGFLITSGSQTSLLDLLKIPLWRQRTLKAIQSGCVYWQPDSFPGNETFETMEENRVFLADIRQYDLQDEKMVEELERRVILTFAAQRFYINGEKERSILDLHDQWPILFYDKFLHMHFEQMTQVSVDVLSTRYHSELAKLLAFGILSKVFTAIPPPGYSQQLQSLNVIMQFFKEELFDLIMVVPIESELQELSVRITEYPAIVVRETENPRPGVPVERSILVTYNGVVCINPCADLIDALKSIMALYFMMNRCYPKKLACFLEFVQRGWLNIGPEESRSKDMNNAKKAYTSIHQLNETVIADSQ